VIPVIMLKWFLLGGNPIEQWRFLGDSLKLLPVAIANVAQRWDRIVVRWVSLKFVGTGISVMKLITTRAPLVELGGEGPWMQI
jgi:hypothetical protein